VLFEEYKNMYAPTEVTDPSEAKGGRGGKPREVIAKRMKMTNYSSSTTKSELEKYLTEETEHTDIKIDILFWWKVDAHSFPILAHMPHNVLSIPISTVVAESVFCMSGRISNDFRTSLTSFMLEALVCTQDWLRRTTSINI
jgi:hypothetical protein